MNGLYPLLYLADEPEAHLHPTAIREVVEVCHELARTSAGGVVVATHALDFLGGPDMVITPYLVSEGAPERCPAGLPSLRERANELGISPAMVLMSARAVLCVEGPTDHWVLEHFTDGELDRAFVHTLRLFGMEELADRLPELDLLFSLDIPVYILLDHVRASKLRDLLAGKRVSDPTKEERELARLAQSLRGRSATVIPMAKVDIVRAIPDAAMELAVRELGLRSWPGWPALDADIEQRWQQKKIVFKDAFEELVDAQVDQVVGLLKRQEDTKFPFTSPELMRITHALVADLSAGAYRTAGEGLGVLKG